MPRKHRTHVNEFDSSEPLCSLNHCNCGISVISIGAQRNREIFEPDNTYSKISWLRSKWRFNIELAISKWCFIHKIILNKPDGNGSPRLNRCLFFIRCASCSTSFYRGYNAQQDCISDGILSIVFQINYKSFLKKKIIKMMDFLLLFSKQKF